MNKAGQLAATMAGAGVLIASLTYAYQQVAPHISEESCIIQGMGTAPDSSALLARACHDRFEKTPAERNALDPWVIAAIDGKAGFMGQSVRARLYNGDSLHTITKLRIGVTDPETADAEEPDTRYYNVSVNIPPLSSRSEEFSVLQTFDKVQWHIADAWGYNSAK